jgi:hypothetical protein
MHSVFSARVAGISAGLLAFGIGSLSLMAAPINLAPFGVASTSSEGFGAVVTDGNDGNRDGQFGNGSVFHTQDPDLAAFYEVDLGASYFLDRVQILPRSDTRQSSVENFRLTVFADDGAGNAGPVVFTQDYFPTGAANFAWGAPELGTSTPGGTFGRFVRLDRLDPTPDFLTFAEFEVYGSPAPIGTNVAIGKPVTASTPGFGATLTSGVDGNLDGSFFNPGTTVYHSETQAVGQFYQVDLGETVALDYLELFDRNDSDTTTQFRVSVLNAGGIEVFSTVVDSAGLTAYDHAIDVSGVSGQFIRLETTLPQFLAFSEIRAFAIPEPGAGGLLAALGMTCLTRRRARRGQRSSTAV